MPTFTGFPSGASPFVPLPEQFFTAILPEIEDLNELKVTLYLFWLLYRKYGSPRCASDREMLADPVLRRTLQRSGDPRPLEERLRAALDAALARGTLLRLRVQVDDELVTWYFFHTERSRRAIAQLQSGEQTPDLLLDLEGPAAGAFAGQRLVVLEAERPNIFTLYEQNIGMLPPLLAEELREAAETYPPEWIEEAFRLAVQQNKRRWSYIRAILKRWHSDGKGEQAYGPYERYSR